GREGERAVVLRRRAVRAAQQHPPDPQEALAPAGGERRSAPAVLSERPSGARQRRLLGVLPDEGDRGADLESGAILVLGREERDSASAARRDSPPESSPSRAADREWAGLGAGAGMRRSEPSEASLSRMRRVMDCVLAS